MPLTEHGKMLRKREMDNQPIVIEVHRRQNEAKANRSGAGPKRSVDRKLLTSRTRMHNGVKQVLHATKGWRDE